MAAAVAVALMAMSVSGQAQAAPNGPGKVSAKVLAQGLRSDYSRPVLMIVQSSCQWDAEMASLSASHSLVGGPDLEPQVDWANQTVVVVALGSLPYGYNSQLTGARQGLGGLILNVHVDYQHYQNSIEGVNPVMLLVVDGHDEKRVHVEYDMDLAGLQTDADAPRCGEGGGPGLRGNGASSSLAMTWGAVKSSYR
jgi:hypothetical protein